VPVSFADTDTSDAFRRAAKLAASPLVRRALPGLTVVAPPGRQFRSDLDQKDPFRMRTLAVWLVLAVPASLGASSQPHSVDQSPRSAATRAKPAVARVAMCKTGCHIHKERVLVRHLRHRIVRRSLAAFLPRPRPAHLSWRLRQVHRELTFWARVDRRTKRLARVPLSVRIPRWHEWQCIARYESTTDWKMSPTSSPPSGGEYWGGLQMDGEFMQTYGADMIRRHHGGLANTWTSAEQIVVANRAWKTRGYQPWPNTSRDCGLR
jgi:hypothetical protein